MPKRTVVDRMIRRLGFVLTASIIIMFVSVVVLTIFYAIVEGGQGEKERSLFDWLYFTVITTRTIGFGDITPQTMLGKLGTIANALLPASLFFGASLVVLQNFFAWLEDHYRRRKMASLTGHHIIVADEDLMESIVLEYSHQNISFVCVNKSPLENLPPRLQDMLDEGTYCSGDPTRDEVLKSVNIDDADAIVIATSDDNINLYVLVTAKGIRRDLKAIVRVNRLETESKFRSVGADTLLPSGTMVGRMLSTAAVNPVALGLLIRLQTGTAHPSLEEIPVTAELAGRSPRIVVDSPVAVYRDGDYRFDLDTISLHSGDVVLRIASE